MRDGRLLSDLSRVHIHPDMGRLGPLRVCLPSPRTLGRKVSQNKHTLYSPEYKSDLQVENDENITKM